MTFIPDPNAINSFAQFSNSPSMQAAIAPQVPMSTQPQAQSPLNNFNSQYQNFLAPYQAAAQKIYGGNPVFGNNAFTQKHPELSSLASNILLGLTKAQPGMTPADSMRVIANMVAAPMQANRQQQLNLATAPGQLMAPQMALMQHLSQMNYQNSEINRNSAMSDYYSGAKTDQAEAAAQRANAPKTHFGAPVLDPSTNQWVQPEYDSASGKMTSMSPLPGGPKTAASNPNSDYTLSGIMRRISSGDPKAKDDLATYIQTAGGMAGARVGGEQGAPHQYTDKQTLISDAQRDAYKDIPALPNQKDWEQNDQLNTGNLDDPTRSGRWAAIQQKHDSAIANRKQQLSYWQTSKDAANLVPFDPNKDYTPSQSQATQQQSRNPFR